MRPFLLFLLVTVLAFPALAQTLDDTYTLDTGTQVNYPSNWDAEEADGLLILTRNDSRVLIVDYPLFSSIVVDQEEDVAAFAVEVIANEILGDEINPDEIYFFDSSDGRAVAAYDFDEAVSGSLFAIEFTNGSMGMLIAVNVDEDFALEMLASFDNTEEISDDVSVSTREASDKPSLYIFEHEGRFLLPANWTLETRRYVDLQYTIVHSPDEDLTAMLFDLSALLPSGTELADVYEASEIDWEDNFGFELTDDAEAYNIGEREAIAYPIEVGRDDGLFIVLRFRNDSIAAAIVYGELDDYESELAFLLGSFNDLNASLELIQ
jgi:hypothetical protein